MTANELHVPVGRTANLTLSSADVIHSFWVPQIGGKRDLNPGSENRLWFTPTEVGEYYGQCAELCGTSHAQHADARVRGRLGDVRGVGRRDARAGRSGFRAER